MKKYKKTTVSHAKQRVGTSPLFYIVLTVVAAALLFIGNRVAVDGLELLGGEQDEYQICRVDFIKGSTVDYVDMGGGVLSETTTTTFLASVIYGEKKDEVIASYQEVDTASYGTRTVVKAGDRVFLQNYGSDGEPLYIMTGFYRIDIVILFAAVFCVLLIVFGGFRGVSAIISLALSLLSVFAFFVPAILNNFNVYFCAVLVCLYNIMLSPFLIGGLSKKAVAAALGCCGGVAIAAGVTLLLDRLLHLSGVTDEDMLYVSFLLTEEPLDLHGIIFASVLIGALGATIDVSMSIASPVMELNETKPMTFGELIKCAFNMGRDIMGAQTATLVLAYVGCSLSVVLVLVSYQNSMMVMMNLEMVVSEIMEALVGAFAILFTIPATAVTTSLLCTKRPKQTEETE